MEGDQKDSVAYTVLQKRLNFCLTKVLDGQRKASVDIQVERECRKAETHVTEQAQDIQARDTTEDQR